MAARNKRSAAEVRREIASEREQLASALESLRAGLRDATDVGATLRANLPAAAGVSLGAGFVLAGGIGATMRLFARRAREGKTKAHVGPFSLVERR